MRTVVTFALTLPLAAPVAPVLAADGPRPAPAPAAEPRVRRLTAHPHQSLGLAAGQLPAVRQAVARYLGQLGKLGRQRLASAAAAAAGYTVA